MQQLVPRQGEGEARWPVGSAAPSGLNSSGPKARLPATLAPPPHPRPHSEAIASIRTVAAYGGERAESRRYATFLRAAEAVGTRKGFAMGATVGAIFATLQGAYGVALWYGAHKVRQGSSRE